jgi:hypothetical protein
VYQRQKGELQRQPWRDVAVRRRGRRGAATPVAEKGETALLQPAREDQQQGSHTLNSAYTSDPRRGPHPYTSYTSDLRKGPHPYNIHIRSEKEGRT